MYAKNPVDALDRIYDLDILHFLQYLLTYVRAQSLDGHDVQFLTLEEAFEHIAPGHEVLEGLLFGLEINQYIDVAAWLVLATHRRAEQSQFRHRIATKELSVQQACGVLFVSS